MTSRKDQKDPAWAGGDPGDDASRTRVRKPGVEEASKTQVRQPDAGDEAAAAVEEGATAVQTRPETRRVPTKAVETAARAAEWGLMLALFGGAFGSTFVATTMFVVKGTGSAALEDVSGRGVWEASQALVRAGFQPRVDHFEDSDELPPHAVLSTSPGPGSELRPGAVVKLVVSRGGRRVLVPNVQGFHLDQARLVLSRNGLVGGNVVTVSHESAPAGTVLASAPAPNAAVAQGDAVRLLVSGGVLQRAWIMPELEGAPRLDAERIFEELGVQVRVSRLRDPAQPQAVILEQFPAPGEALRQGEVVRLIVNEAEVQAQAEGARLVPLRIEVPSGLVHREVVVRVTRGDWTRTVLRRFVRPGTVLNRAVFVGPGDRVVVQVDDRELLRRRY